MDDKKTRFFLSIGIIILLLLITAPYVYAWQAAGDDYVFGGFLPNPLDGNSYLAKMRQGFEGNWSFTLPYSVEPGEPTFINMFYVFLGHIARITTLPLIAIYHIFRLAGAVLLSLVIWHIIKRIFPDNRDRLLTWLFLSFGLGSGWLEVILFPQFLLEGLSTDLWVAEAYPFLSVFTNAHFPFGLALMLWLLSDFVVEDFQLTVRNSIWVFLKALLLSLIMPFGMPILGLVIAIVYVYRLIIKEYALIKILDSIPLIVGGVPMVLYYLVTTASHPVLKIWNAQNQTVSPNLVDLFFSFSPALIFSIVGIWGVIRNREKKFYPLVFWLVTGLIVLYIPVPFQRRFISGLYFPVVVLAIAGMKYIFDNKREKLNLVWFAVFTTSLISSILVMATGFKVAQTKEPLIYLSNDEAEICIMLADLDLEGGLVLADTRLGNFLPACANVRVLFGHPLETVNAGEMAAEVNTFYLGHKTLLEQKELLDTFHVDYLLIDSSKYPDLMADYQDLPVTLSSGDLFLLEIVP